MSKAEIRDASLKDKMATGALGNVSGEWVCVCVLVGGCLHGCVNEEVISGVNAWQRAKG